MSGYGSGGWRSGWSVAWCVCSLFLMTFGGCMGGSDSIVVVEAGMTLGTAAERLGALGVTRQESTGRPQMYVQGNYRCYIPEYVLPSGETLVIEAEGTATQQVEEFVVTRVLLAERRSGTRLEHSGRWNVGDQEAPEFPLIFREVNGKDLDITLRGHHVGKTGDELALRDISGASFVNQRLNDDGSVDFLVNGNEPLAFAFAGRRVKICLVPTWVHAYPRRPAVYMIQVVGPIESMTSERLPMVFEEVGGRHMEVQVRGHVVGETGKELLLRDMPGALFVVRDKREDGSVDFLVNGNVPLVFLRRGQVVRVQMPSSVGTSSVGANVIRIQIIGKSD